MTAPTQAGPRAETPSNGAPVPPLRDGDRLDRDEFHRRYLAMPEVKKAELIEGVVHMPSPVSYRDHGLQHGRTTTWLGVYAAHTPGTGMAPEATVRLDMGNEPQPEVLLLIDPARGGRTEQVGGYVVGGPELAAEVAASSVSIDRNAKLRAYRDNGVQEYILWRVADGAIDWFTLHGGQYDPLPVGAGGIVRSEVFPGLWLDVSAILAGDMLRVRAVLQQGVASPEHAAFVAALQPPAVP